MFTKSISYVWDNFDSSRVLHTIVAPVVGGGMFPIIKIFSNIIYPLITYYLYFLFKLLIKKTEFIQFERYNSFKLELL